MTAHWWQDVAPTPGFRPGNSDQPRYATAAPPHPSAPRKSGLLAGPVFLIPPAGQDDVPARCDGGAEPLRCVFLFVASHHTDDQSGTVHSRLQIGRAHSLAPARSRLGLTRAG